MLRNRFMFTVCMKNKYTKIDEHCFCKNLVDRLVDCKISSKIRGYINKFAALVVEKINSCKHGVKLRSMTID